MSGNEAQRRALVLSREDAEANFDGAPVGQYVHPCADAHLSKLTVVSGATQNGLRGEPDEWATVRRDGAEVIVEVATSPNTEEVWSQVVWGGDTGRAVPGKGNQRAISRAESRVLQVSAALGYEIAHVSIWVVAAEVTILTKGTRPKRAPAFIDSSDGTPRLGVVVYDGGRRAEGRIVAVAALSPLGVGRVVRRGWNIRRDLQGHQWIDGVPQTGDDRFFSEPNWADDTSDALFKTLDPGDEDRIYDTDAPDIGSWSVDDVEVDYNFRQWAEWNAADKESGGMCSARALWHWEAIWKRGERPEILLANVDTGNVKLMERSFLHPKGRARP